MKIGLISFKYDSDDRVITLRYVDFRAVAASGLDRVRYEGFEQRFFDAVTSLDIVLNLQHT